MHAVLERDSERVHLTGGSLPFSQRWRECAPVPRVGSLSWNWEQRRESTPLGRGEDARVDGAAKVWRTPAHGSGESRECERHRSWRKGTRWKEFYPRFCNC